MFFTSCVSTKKYNASLAREEQLRADVLQLNNTVAQLRADIGNLQNENSN
jgi:outer membrane murein-binding lipoprotein Lpp